ncbi:STAS domain-containing protein [Kitasatospora cathayae]|uniref:Anti-sigma factor antagonist n=1 Tax=Kitasatospora cathayae TaxID=3004092 RepID=A0ABY7PY41_9ACTN|nr:STAS domain-containing protein [Kitasatospora sp. HUAS 3-15]WBP85280.1 STAS domain-containing protein [Kitasatospora sp. HUAS 3-15]
MPAEKTMPAENESVTVPPTTAPSEPSDPSRPGAPSGPDLAVRTWHTATRAAVCALAGDLDIETLAPARNTLDDLVEQHPPLLVVDLAGVGFCDSSGLNLLLRTRMAAAAADVGFRLAAPSTTVRRLLELTCADTVFSLHPTVAAALAAPR